MNTRVVIVNWYIKDFGGGGTNGMEYVQWLRSNKRNWSFCRTVKSVSVVGKQYAKWVGVLGLEHWW